MHKRLPPSTAPPAAIQFPPTIRPMVDSIFRSDFSPNTSSSVVVVVVVES
ncbi:MAG: hypothetical protein RLZZ245_245, partial [Verrucomicrobiota bacterium]